MDKKSIIVFGLFAVVITVYTQWYAKQTDARFDAYQTNVRVERCERLYDEQELFADFHADVSDQRECKALTGMEL